MEKNKRSVDKEQEKFTKQEQQEFLELLARMTPKQREALKKSAEILYLKRKMSGNYDAARHLYFLYSGIISPVRMPELGLSWQIAVLGKACPIRSGAVFDHPSGDGRNCPLQRIEKA